MVELLSLLRITSYVIKIRLYYRALCMSVCNLLNVVTVNYTLIIIP